MFKNQYKVKICRICNKGRMFKIFNTFRICDECKKTEEYKKYTRERNKNCYKPSKANIEKKCKFCENILTVKKYSSMVVCDECKKNKPQNYKEFWKNRNNKINKTVKKRYGVNNSFLIKDKNNEMKRVLTYRERYNVDNPLQNKEIYNKTQRTNLKRYGIKNPFQDVKNIQKSMLNKYGVTNPNFLPEFRKKIEETNLKKYGYINNLSRPHILEKGKQTRLERYGREYPISIEKFRFTKPHKKLKEKIDLEILDHNFETEKFIQIEKKAYSLDEYDKHKKIIIFVDGDYWHANPKFYKENDVIKNRKASEIWEYDKNVTNILRKNGYSILRFWEYDINNNINECVSLIKSILNGRILNV